MLLNPRRACKQLRFLPYSCGTIAAGACGIDPSFRCHTAQPSRVSRAAVLPYHVGPPYRRANFDVSHRCASRLLKRCFNAPFFVYSATFIVRAICGAGRQRAASTTAPIDAHSMRAVLMLTLSTSGLPLQGQLGYFGGLVSIPVTVEDCYGRTAKGCPTILSPGGSPICPILLHYLRCRRQPLTYTGRRPRGGLWRMHLSH